MKKLLIFASIMAFFIAGCSKTESVNVLRLPTGPIGEFIILKSGSLVGQNSSKLFGSVEFGIDGSNNYLVHLLSDFTTDFGSNINTLILSKNGVYDTKTDVPITLLNSNGEKYFKISLLEYNTFSNLILLNTAANVTIASSALKSVISNNPIGAFTVQRTGIFVTQASSPATSGTVQIGTDAAGVQWLKFNANFVTETASGAAVVDLSKGSVYADNTVIAIGAINKIGEQYFKITTPVGNEYTHVIIWCMAAKIPFGNAPLK